MLTIKVLHAICFIVMMNKVEAEVYSATEDVGPLLKAQQKIIYDLEGFIEMEKKRLTVLEKNLEFFKKEHKIAVEDIPNYIGNPVNTYSLIKRLTVDLEFIENITKIPIVFDRDEALEYPTREDLRGSILALTRLQETYLLNTTSLSNGLLNGTFSHGNYPFTETFTPMSASDCYEIGVSLYKAANYKGSLEWMTEALWKYDDNTPEAYYFTVVNVIDHITGTYRILDDIPNALKYTKILLTMVPDHLITAKGKEVIEQYEKRIAEEEKAQLEKKIAKESDENGKVTDNRTDRDIYKALCRGDVVSPSVATKRLKCRYLTENSPFLKLAPVKMEELFTEPNVYMFHEVLSDDEIDIIKKTAQPNFQRASVLLASNESTPTVVDHRVCKLSWLHAGSSVTADKISRRVSDLTGMTMETAESFQVANYGIGGQYEPHHDFFHNYNAKTGGNRIGTVLFYMSDVAQGGATVFPKLGLTVFPVKGAAIFWWNLHSSGEKDMDSLHAACPVLRGSKWITNKWIRQIGQELMKPCSLEYQGEAYNRNIPRPLPKFHEHITSI